MGRNLNVTYAKAIGIILMVLGHAGCGLPKLVDVVYMFHMPLFFFFSGYCFKEKYFDQARVFLRQRVKGLYWPYVKWSLLFLLLHNLFFHLNIYNATYGKNSNCDHLYSLEEIAYKVYVIVTHVEGHDPLLGGFWFLRTLFFASILSFAILYVAHRLQEKWGVSPKVLDSGALAFVILLSMLVNHYEIDLPYFHYGVRFTYASTFFLLGHYFAKYKVRMFKGYESVAAFSVVVIGSFFWLCKMDYSYFDNMKMLCAIVTAVFGIWCVYSFPWERLGGRVVSFLEWTGDNTLIILTWHVLCFKPVTLLIIWVYDLQIEQLAKIMTIHEYASRGWWLLYLLAGVCIPLLFIHLADMLKIQDHTNRMVSKVKGFLKR